MIIELFSEFWGGTGTFMALILWLGVKATPKSRSRFEKITVSILGFTFYFCAA
jgi:hypothetical protein